MTIAASALFGVSDASAALGERLRRGVAVVRPQGGGNGAGTLWREGLVITNHHVAATDRVTVIFDDDQPRLARVVARAPALDLAALAVETGDRAPLPAGDSDRLRPGQLALAVGHPLGAVGSVTAGIISAVGRLRGAPVPWPAAVQANITLLPGNSDGPLADATGAVVGINSLVMGPGVAVAVPANTVVRFVSEHVGGGAVLGVAGQTVALPGTAEAAGVLIAAVSRESAAEAAGLLLGDVLLAVDDRPVRSGDELASAIAGKPAGAPRRLVVLRGGVRRELTAAPRARAA